MGDVISLCREGWNATKADHQPAYDDLVEDYRNILSQRAQGAIAGQIEDGPFAAFESYVYEHSLKVVPGEWHSKVESEPLPEVKVELVEEAIEEAATVKPKPKAKTPRKKAAKPAPKKAAIKKAAKRPVKVIKKATTQKGAKKR